MHRALDFLGALRRAEADGEMLRPFADDPEGFGAAIDHYPGELAALIAEGGATAAGTVADLHSDAFASAAAQRDGSIVVADARFADWLHDSDLIARILSELTDDPRVAAIADGRNGRPVAIAAARAASARRWPVAPEVAAAVEAGRASHVVLAFSPGDDSWAAAAKAYALTASEVRLLRALASEGELRAASGRVGIAYETGRKLVASAMRKTGASRQSDLVRYALSVAAGDITPPAHTEALFAELFGLRVREARLAREVANGATRNAAAARVGVSSAGTKAALKAVYAACGVSSAVDLSRIVAEVDALAGLADACDVVFHLPGRPSGDPLRFVPRPTGGRIAVSDHGPADGMPVIVFHTTTGGRAQSPRLLAALREPGIRAIVVERPGYGLTDSVGTDIWAAAARDVAAVLDALDIPRALILSRGGAQPAVVTASQLGTRIAGGILLGPDPPVELDRARSGMMGRTKGWVYDTPAMLEPLAAILSRRTSSDQIARMMRESVRGSAIDQAVCDDPAEMAALVRGGRQSALGMRGFVMEHAAQGARLPLPVLADGTNWTVMSGAQDPLYFAEDARDYWLGRLPGCAFVIEPDGGRFLHATHSAQIVRRLQSLWVQS
ncbi:alpha/beta fold hydrolase [Sphingomonas sp. SUN039]|uniref:alpha/beta fold hydrolase n=1 Tax=Sphingomonas sp. SUN039 TaxID=2937787 RepID=UPI0021643EB4|nr:alpha/beta hydrolase [Sphingomonas sp. SUN039]UVO55053.1 alpha/beta hydrolase [Sphingomonas sp. SUN039]